MWAILVETYDGIGNLVPLGNDGYQKLHNKTRHGWKRETQFMRNHSTGTVYVVNEFTQAMCNMDCAQLADYVISHHVDVL